MFHRAAQLPHSPWHLPHPVKTAQSLGFAVGLLDALLARYLLGGGSENGIHGLPWNPKTGVQVWTGSVGKPITFGCVMLDNVNAKMLYNMAWIGMPVMIKP